MKHADWKQRFAADHQLAHLDPTVLDLLLDRPDPVTSEAVSTLTNELLISILNESDFGTNHEDSGGWSARIKASMPEVSATDDDVDVDDETSSLFDEDREHLVPQHIRAELEADIARAGDELRPLRTVINQERPVANAHPPRTIVRTIKQPGKADWVKWLAMPSWTAAETAALLLDLDPVDVKLPGQGLPGKVRSAFKAKLDHVVRHVGAGNLPDSMTPDAVKEWALNHKQDVPAMLVEDNTNSSKKPDKDPDHIHHLTKAMYQKVFLYLAVKHYGYDVDDVKEKIKGKTSNNGGVGMNSIAAEMERDLEKAGVKISAKTLSEHLGLAAADLIGSGGKGVYVNLLRAAKKQR